MEDKRSTRVLKAWWRLSTKGPRCQTKIGILLLICSSLGISNIFWAYSRLSDFNDLAAGEGPQVSEMPTLERRLKEENTDDEEDMSAKKRGLNSSGLKGGLRAEDLQFRDNAVSPERLAVISSTLKISAVEYVDKKEDDSQRPGSDLSTRQPHRETNKKENKKKVSSIAEEVQSQETAPDRPSAVPSSKQVSGDPCREELTTTVTLSMSEFCQEDATSDFDNLSSQFDILEQHLVPYAYMFNETEWNYTAVIVPNVLCQRKEHVDSSDITLTTQMSTNKVTRLVALAARWNGPVSVAVKVTSVEDLRNFQLLLTEHSEHLQKVAFHLYFESEHRAYPNNVLRNLALTQVQSDYFAIFDVDLLPSPMNTHEHLRATFDNNSKLKDKLDHKTVFVLPAWEITETIADENITIQHPSYPESRESIIELDSVDDDRQVEVFRHVFERGHRSTDYYKWVTDLKDESYPMKVIDYGYEPYIVGAMKGAPRFFSDFRGYGFNKASYFVELHYAKYSFEVLRDFFIFHVNHPASYGDEKRNKTRKVNMVCIQYFLDYLTREYGAGYLGTGNEVAGWHIWKRRRAQGIYYDTWGETEEESSEEGESSVEGEKAQEE